MKIDPVAMWAFYDELEKMAMDVDPRKPPISPKPDEPKGLLGKFRKVMKPLTSWRRYRFAPQAAHAARFARRLPR